MLPASFGPSNFDPSEAHSGSFRSGSGGGGGGGWGGGWGAEGNAGGGFSSLARHRRWIDAPWRTTANASRDADADAADYLQIAPAVAQRGSFGSSRPGGGGGWNKRPTTNSSGAFGDRNSDGRSTWRNHNNNNNNNNKNNGNGNGNGNSHSGGSNHNQHRGSGFRSVSPTFGGSGTARGWNRAPSGRGRTGDPAAVVPEHNAFAEAIDVDFLGTIDTASLYWASDGGNRSTRRKDRHAAPDNNNLRHRNHRNRIDGEDDDDDVFEAEAHRILLQYDSDEAGDDGLTRHRYIGGIRGIHTATATATAARVGQGRGRDGQERRRSTRQFLARLHQGQARSRQQRQHEMWRPQSFSELYDAPGIGARPSTNRARNRGASGHPSDRSDRGGNSANVAMKEARSRWRELGGGGVEHDDETGGSALNMVRSSPPAMRRPTRSFAVANSGRADGRSHNGNSGGGNNEREEDDYGTGGEHESEHEGMVYSPTSYQPEPWVTGRRSPHAPPAPEDIMSTPMPADGPLPDEAEARHVRVRRKTVPGQAGVTNGGVTNGGGGGMGGRSGGGGAAVPALMDADVGSGAYSANAIWCLFDKYADPLDPNLIAPYGLYRFCCDLDVACDNMALFALCWKMDTEMVGYITRDEWVSGMASLGVDSVSRIIGEALPALERELTTDDSAFRAFYIFCYHLVRQPSQRHIPRVLACALWGMLLAGRYNYVDELVEFVQTQSSYDSINLDQWRNIFDFVMTVTDFADYDPCGSWPVLCDSFVSWIQTRSAME